MLSVFVNQTAFIKNLAFTSEETFLFYLDIVFMAYASNIIGNFSRIVCHGLLRNQRCYIIFLGVKQKFQLLLYRNAYRVSVHLSFR